MSDKIYFIEVEPEESCWRCGRNKLSENDKFYRVFVGDNDMGIVVCELCRGGFSTRMVEGVEKSYVTHLTFYVKRSLLGLKKKLPKKIAGDLDSAVESYEAGEFSASFRSIGLVAEWLTDSLFLQRLGEPQEKEKPSWENKLGRLLDTSRKNKKFPEEPIVHQLFCLKWFRNVVDHPSIYEVTGEDVRLGLAVIVYLLQQAYTSNLT
jgi:hypothetical protein